MAQRPATSSESLASRHVHHVRRIALSASDCTSRRTAPPSAARRTRPNALRSNPMRYPPPAAPLPAPSARKATPASVAVSKLENGWNGLRLMSRARDRRVQEVQIEVRVVTDQDRARAVVVLHRATDVLEQARQRFLLRNRRSQRMIRIDAVHRERRSFELRARETAARDSASPRRASACRRPESRSAPRRSRAAHRCSD